MMDLPLNVDFSGKVVVVTGAGGVLCMWAKAMRSQCLRTMSATLFLGSAFRLPGAFAQAGAKVAALDLNEEAVKQLAEECKAEGFVCEGYKANVLGRMPGWAAGCPGSSA